MSPGAQGPRAEKRRRPLWWPEGENWPPRRRRPTPAAMAWRTIGFLIFTVLGPTVFCLGVLWLLGLLDEPSSPVSSLAWAAVLVLLAGLFFAIVSGLRRLALPLGDLIDAAGRVEQGDYSVRVQARGPRGLRVLGRAFNDMAKQLELTEQQRRDLMADLSHELRTPVSVIQGHLEALADGVYPADEEHLAPVLEEARLISRLIEDLRTLSEAETGTLELRREPTDLALLIREVVESYRARAQSAEVELRTELDDELPLLEVDPLRIREVLVNLISNALRYTEAGGRVFIAARLEPGNGISVSIADNGGGISPEVLPHIFERFYKAPGSTGSGLGLTIARDLVDAHGGSIEAESEVGRGTTLRFHLPTQAT